MSCRSWQGIEEKKEEEKDVKRSARSIYLIHLANNHR